MYIQQVEILVRGWHLKTEMVMVLLTTDGGSYSLTGTMWGPAVLERNWRTEAPDHTGIATRYLTPFYSLVRSVLQTAK